MPKNFVEYFDVVGAKIISSNYPLQNGLFKILLPN